METEIKGLIERGVVALEALAQDPVIEIEAAPPICPHCNRHNPLVEVPEGSDGPLAECVLLARCNHCSRNFYAVPVTWHMFVDRESVLAELQERREMQNGSN